MSATTYAAGLYKAEILSQGFGTSARKGTPFFFVQVKILGRYDAQGTLQACPQYERTVRQYLTHEVSINIFKTMLKALQVEVTNLEQLDLEAANPISLVGRQLDLLCQLENFEGRTQEQWSLPLRKKMDLSAVRALNDRFGHLLRGESARKPAIDPVVPNPDQTPF